MKPVEEQGDRIWCYQCKVWVKDSKTRLHFTGRAHLRQGTGKKDKRKPYKSRRGKGSRIRRKLKSDQGVFSNQILDKNTLNKNDLVNVAAECNDNTTRDKLASEVSSPGFSQSFIESHAFSEQGAIPAGNSKEVLNDPSMDDNTDNHDKDLGQDSIPYSATDFLPVKLMESDPSKFLGKSNSIPAEKSETNPVSHPYDLRSKLSKLPAASVKSSESIVSDSFSRRLDMFLKEIRQQSGSAFKSQF